MSFTKKQIKNDIIKPIESIQNISMNDNDLGEMMKYLTVCEYFQKVDDEVSKI